MTGILRHQRQRHSRLRLGGDKAAVLKHDDQDGSAGGKNEYASHGFPRV